ncbi:glycolate oxidase subunit GlcE [Bordetella sp. 02P26C-1]|uniref:glycolate oxidase subunit GlcE n=1 Tax=Bordetella sp. 02P26C-1 TaxID=2683195 RepID=UPI001353EADD|nr:glycolate oxidase subunit GlcE [Bordetella sp. 02P26C-1]MVW80642.1 glycolate oxidase subunit GlcE [Bordetella sp. 02P26C-1]
MQFVLSELCDQVMTAHAGHKPLYVCGGGSKSFYGNYRPVTPQDGHCLLDMSAYNGIINYQPSELVVTVRAGTSLAALEAELAEYGQMLAFESPHFGASSTVGGCVAAGLAGPRRMAVGGVRDFVLGARLLDSQGRLLSFGGEVMKNVAGYDVSRLLAGSLGIFGAIIEVSLKVMPKPFEELSLRFEATQQEALTRFAQWRSQPLAISATSWAALEDSDTHLGADTPGCVTVRLSGAPPAIRAAKAAIGGHELDGAQAADWWRSLREQTHPFFKHGRPLWRVALPPTTPAEDFGAPTLIEWGGGQRWFSGSLDAQAVRARAQTLGGHATLFRAAGGPIPADGVFHPLAPGVAAITRRLKQELDPSGLFNPGRLVMEL